MLKNCFIQYILVSWYVFPSVMQRLLKIASRNCERSTTYLIGWKSRITVSRYTHLYILNQCKTPTSLSYVIHHYTYTLLYRLTTTRTPYSIDLPIHVHPTLSTHQYTYTLLYRLTNTRGTRATYSYTCQMIPIPCFTKDNAIGMTYAHIYIYACL